MNDQIQPDGSGAEHDHGALGDAEYAEFMELAAVEGFDIEDVEGAIDEAGHGPLPVLAVVAYRTSASRLSSTASSAAARPSWRTSPASRVTV